MTPQRRQPPYLTHQQQEAADAREETLLITGRPSTGKTRALEARVESLLRERVSPQSILRVAAAGWGSGPGASGGEPRRAARRNMPPIYTPAALANAILRDCGMTRNARIPAGYTVLSHRQAKEMFMDAVRSNPRTRDTNPEDIAQIHRRHRAKRLGVTVNAPLPDQRSIDDSAVGGYEDLKAMSRCVDTDDLLLLAMQVLEENVYAMAMWRRKGKAHLMLDDLQALLPLEYQLVTAISGPDAAFAATADPKMPLGGGMEGAPNLVAKLLSERPDAVELHLDQSFRHPPSNPKVARAAGDHLTLSVGDDPGEVAAAINRYGRELLREDYEWTDIA